MERLIGPTSDLEKRSETNEAVLHPHVRAKRYHSFFMLVKQLVITHKPSVLAAVLVLLFLLIYGNIHAFDLRFNTDYTEIL
ncbi:MAG TPA: hypothetical protein H9672_10725 [Firmicutes bacterium]|nr:hypothetical protein [Bacillota bacterium]